MHHIHKLKDHRQVSDTKVLVDHANYCSNVTACKVLDDLISIRLFREENQPWTEKAVITRIWLLTSNNLAEHALDQLQELFDTVTQNSKVTLSAPATHAAQTVSSIIYDIRPVHPC